MPLNVYLFPPARRMPGPKQRIKRKPKLSIAVTSGKRNLPNQDRASDESFIQINLQPQANHLQSLFYPSHTHAGPFQCIFLVFIYSNIRYHLQPCRADKDPLHVPKRFPLLHTYQSGWSEKRSLRWWNPELRSPEKTARFSLQTLGICINRLCW